MSIKLTYFAKMGLAEPIRWLLSYGTLPFEDIRLSPDEWAEQKEKSPFGQLPILEVQERDSVLHQSKAICRWLADVLFLGGKDQWENYEIDAIVESISDLRLKISNYNKMANNTSEKVQMRKELLEETVPFYLSRLEKCVKGGFLAAGKLTWADIYFAALMDYNNGVLGEDLFRLGSYVLLEAVCLYVRGLPGIRNWIEKRPQSTY